MIVKVNVSVRQSSFKSSFIVQLLEVDTFKDDILAQKVEHLVGESMGYRRARDLPEVIQFEFFVSALSFIELNAELKAVVKTPGGAVIGESAIVDFNFLKEFEINSAKTIDLPEIEI